MYFFSFREHAREVCVLVLTGERKLNTIVIENILVNLFRAICLPMMANFPQLRRNPEVT